MCKKSDSTFEKLNKFWIKEGKYFYFNHILTHENCFELIIYNNIHQKEHTANKIVIYFSKY